MMILKVWFKSNDNDKNNKVFYTIFWQATEVYIFELEFAKLAASTVIVFHCKV
jgi:hypothetical protein